MFRYDSRTGGSSNHDKFAKTRKKLGLNARVDRMVESLGAVRQSSWTNRGNRTRSTSSSIGTSDLSRSPLDAYSHLQEGRLGQHFTLIRGAPVTHADAPLTDPYVPCGSSNLNLSPSQVSNHLPDWLCETFSTLEHTNPLRLLLPQGSLEGSDSQPLAPPGLLTHLSGVETTSISALSGLREEGPYLEEDPRPDGQSISWQAMRTLPHYSQPLYVVPESVSIASLANMHCAIPFSTPASGPLVNAQPTLLDGSISDTAQIHLPHPISVSEMDQLDFIPFLTPGPGSTLSATSDLTFPKRFDPDKLLSLPACSPPPLDDTNSLISPSPPDRHTDSRLPFYSTADHAHSYSSDAVLDSHENLTDDSGSDPHLDPSLSHVYYLQNLYATPEPGFRAARPVYFDSPTEDPSDFDPLQPGYEIDYDSLDFRWEPYFRKNAKDERQQMSGSPKIVAPDLGSRARSLNTLPAPERTPSPCLFRFSVDQLDDQVTPDNISSPIADQVKSPQAYSATAFAPTPGIYLSPLRRDETSSFLAALSPKGKRTLSP